MSPERAKQLSMPDILLQLGHQPVQVKKEGRELWYRSPLRSEKSPSFHITYRSNRNIWVWNDFGSGQGGNLLSFLMEYRNESLGEVLKYLRGLYPDPALKQQKQLFTFHQPGKIADDFNGLNEIQSNALELVRATPIQHTIIHQYLSETRKIPKAIYEPFLEEIHYWNKEKGRGFFAFGIQNESKGYEIRSASDQYVFKSVLKQRDITYIKGNKGQGTTVNVFEGMLDFLSLLALLNVPRLNGDTIIMHSTSTYDRCKAFLELGNFKMINTFLDNDPTGKKCTKKFEEDFHGKVASQSFQFKAFEDLNEVLKNGQKIQFQLLPNP